MGGTGEMAKVEFLVVLLRNLLVRIPAVVLDETTFENRGQNVEKLIEFCG